MKYMIMMFGSAGEMAEVQSPEWITEMIRFMHQLNSDLTSSGELVAAEGLVDGSQAKTVTLEGGVPVATDGPYAEAKESIVGYWVVDVEDEDRVIELGGQIAAWSRVVEVRRVAEEPPQM
jgi:hypothetical protein